MTFDSAGNHQATLSATAASGTGANSAGSKLTDNNHNKRGLELSQASLSNFSFGKHVHLDYHIGVVSRGVQLFSSRKGVEPLAPGRIAMLNPDVVHDGVAQSPDGYSLHVIRLEPQALTDLLQELCEKPQLQWLPDAVIDDPRLYQQLIRLHQCQGKADPLAWQGCWLESMAQLLQQYSGLKPLDDPKKKGLTVQQFDFLRDYLMQDLSAKHKLEDLSELFAMSSYQFLRRFRSYTGMTPHAYLTSLRIDYARRLLRQGGKLADVAAAVGFYDQSHFVHAFRKANGITPSGYRKSICN